MKGYHTYKVCIDACLQCAAICNYCAESCTREEHVQMMAQCIRLNMECAVICNAAAQLMSINSHKSAEICALCVKMCEACAAECASHEHPHCQECAEMCKYCADQCAMVAA